MPVFHCAQFLSDAVGRMPETDIKRSKNAGANETNVSEAPLFPFLFLYASCCNHFPFLFSGMQHWP